MLKCGAETETGGGHVQLFQQEEEAERDVSSSNFVDMCLRAS